MLDIAVAYNRYQFLGNEFLTWLWYVIEKEEATLKNLDKDLVSLDIGNRITLENYLSEATENVTIKGDDAGLEEGLLALKKGAVVTEMNLLYKAGEHEWAFSIKGESLNISGLKPPESGAVEKKEDIEGAVLEKSYLYGRAFELMDALFQHFIQLRISNAWTNETLMDIQNWIDASTKP